MPILEQLDWQNGRVINITLGDDKRTVLLEEACDMYFQQILNKQEFGQLIAELQGLHGQME